LTTRMIRNEASSMMTAIAVIMLLASFLIILVVNRLQRWAQTRIPAH